MTYKKPTIETIAQREAEFLAPYAMKSSETRGRKYEETEHPYRTPFQRDRDRVIHCTAFRRLEYKTQVFVYHEGDHYRTRLTHTMEVAQITRTIARALGLNEDIAEAIALAHDLGHPPFGHTGEEILDELMGDHGGFEHNGHTLRIVEELERRYPKFRGLNLTWEVREGVVKHGSEYDRPEANDEFEMDKGPTLEAIIADMADEIAYNNHDIDDGLSSDLITTDQLNDVALWRENFNAVKDEFPDEDFRIHKAQTIKRIIDAQASDLVENTLKIITDRKINSVEDVRAVGKATSCFSQPMVEKNKELKTFLKDNMYHHNRVLRMANKAKRIISDIFKVYEADPRVLPMNFVSEFDRVGEMRTICDYIAGMTDRFALNEHTKLFDPFEKV